MIYHPERPISLMNIIDGTYWHLSFIVETVRSKGSLTILIHKRLFVRRGGLRMTALFVALFVSSLYANVFQSGSPDEIVEHIDTIVQKKSTNKTSINNLIQALKNPGGDIRVRERAAWALGELRVQNAAPALIEAAGHRGLLIRSSALDALIRLRTKAALPIITKIAESDPILSLRQRATLALGLFRSDSSIPSVVKLSSDPSMEIQGAAALAMAALHSKKNDFSQVLKEMSKEIDPHVKERSLIALDLIGKKNKVVREHLKSEDVDVRLFAAQYFRQQGGSVDATALKDALNRESQNDVRYELEESLKAIKKRADDAKKRQAAAAKPKKP